MTTKTTAAAATEADEEYDRFERLIAQRVATATGPLFTTAATDDFLWKCYLDSLPAARRAHYNCRACQRFISRFGNLVSIGNGGTKASVLWNPVEVPSFFATAARKLDSLTVASRVTGVFLSSTSEWGVERTGNWTHLHGKFANLYVHPTTSASQREAELRGDFGVLSRGLAEYPLPLATEALRVLEADALERSEKAVGVARWLVELHQRLEGVTGDRRDSLVWAAVAAAPVGFCHLRSTVISTLLDDIKSGIGFGAVARRWAEKMHPLQYRRPTAAPSTGQIEAAEKIVERLGLRSAFDRRFANLGEVLLKLWVPRPVTVFPPPPDAGLFDHLRKSTTAFKSLVLPPRRVSWRTFLETVLPTAQQLKVVVPSGRCAFYGLLTAANPTAPPLLQWDGLAEVARNPVSWYFYHNGSTAQQWNLQPSLSTNVTAVFLPPHQWQSPAKFTQFARQVFFALEGARDLRAETVGSCLFPENLRSELHGVRAVIEAHSNATPPTGAENGNANGIAFDGRDKSNLQLLVQTVDGGPEECFLLDHWD